MAKTPRFRPTASFWEANRIALDSLWKNKLRTFLTLLGIILATATLITVSAFIHGMNLYIAEKVSDMGADGFRIVRMAWFGPWDPKKFYEMMKRNPEIKRDDNMYCWAAEKVKLHLNGVKGVSPQKEFTGFELAMRALTDHQFVTFVPGIGITAYIYGHHGTVSEGDVKLVEFWGF